MSESYFWGRWEVLGQNDGKLVLLNKTYYIHVPKRIVEYLRKKYGDVENLRCEVQLVEHESSKDVRIVVKLRKEKLGVR